MSVEGLLAAELFMDAVAVRTGHQRGRPCKADKAYP